MRGRLERQPVDSCQISEWCHIERSWLARDTRELRESVAELLGDMNDGYYPSSGFGRISRSITRLMANVELNARVEGVISKHEDIGFSEHRNV